MPIDLAWLRSQMPDRRIEWFTTIESTMIAASRLAAAGAPSGTVVGADEQTAGQGRYGRAWHSEPESGLYVSVILRRRFPPVTLPVITLALGLAVREAIFSATALECDLRWPNDVLIQSKKCAGILTQLESSGQSSAIIAGIGINVNHSSFPADLSETATSLRIASGHLHSRERLLVQLLASVDTYCDVLEKHGREHVLQLFAHASSYVQGRRVRVEEGATDLCGVTAGLTDSGHLKLRADDGREWTVLVGGLRPCS